MENKGGEVRRIHIIYFLSHIGGRADHPHLIRVLHLARNGVYLRDVKRWLGELRGKDLPEAFSWSYKRRYKTGYVWQDLFDDDLITPISDNEYVLKGSQIHPTTFEIISPDEKKTASNVLLSEKKSPQVHVAKDNKKTSLEEEQQQPRIRQDTDSKTDTPTKVSSSEISQDSLVFSSDRLSSVTDEYDEDNKPLEESRKESFEEQNNEKLENSSSSSLPSLYHNLLNKNGSNKQDLSKTDTPDSSISTPSSSSSSQSSFSKLRSNSTRVSTALRNLITCGSVDTIDAALIRMKPNQKTVSNINDPNNLAENKAQICKGDRLGGSARCFRNSWNHHCQQNQYGARKSFDAEETNRTRKKLGDFMNQTQHKPFGGPICSQCRKQFKPEKMHKHMKSCKGMKVLGTTVSDAEKTQHHRSSTSDHSNYLLTN